jgi:4-amino-4-deoxy-L-arabinose transferase-like glycosyltransferase
MNNSDNSEQVSSLVSYFIGGVSAVISVVIVIFIIGTVKKVDLSVSTEVEDGVMLLSFLLPFCIFFGVVALRGLIPSIANQRELMSVLGWRVLACLLLAIGVIGSIFTHWVTILLPGIIALICIAKDPKIK